MRLSGVLLTFVLAMIPVHSADQPVPTREAADRMAVPEGFRVTLFAGEPDIVQPIAFTFDDRGRMWVVECLSYPKWSHDGTGKDRVVILEDTNGDGTHDKKTVFLDNGSNLSGIELGFGGVFLCSSPNLIFIPIKDDRPAGPPEVLLDGWNIKDTKHNVFNGLGWGPDGWLYGCNGIQAKAWVGKPGTPQQERIYIDCGVWRYHPTRKVFEAVAHGTTNPWGLDWDDHGEMFITNCVIDHLWHVVPGGHYERMYGQDANPYTFGLMGPASDHKHWGGGPWTSSRADLKTGALQKEHDDAGGGHAHSGCMIYLGENFPPEYRNSVFMCNIHGNRINRDTLKRQGWRYTGQHAPDFLHANDPWFRGIFVKQGPEGALYVSDWTDTGECHNYDIADTSNGRIYRVAYGSPRPFQGDVSKFSHEELVRALVSKNEWLARKARQVLQERAHAGATVATLIADLPITEPATEYQQKLRKLWALHAVGGLTEDMVTRELSRPDGPYTGWVARLAVDHGKPSANVIAALRVAANQASTPADRAALAMTLPRLPARDAINLAQTLFKHPEDNADVDLTHLYWYGVEAGVRAEPALALQTLGAVPLRRVRENTARAFIKQPNTPDEPHVSVREVLPHVVAAGDDAARVDFLRGIMLGLADRKPPQPLPEWTHLYKTLSLSSSAAVRDLAADIGLRFNDKTVTETLKLQMTDTRLEAGVRQSAIRKLTSRTTPGLAPTLRNLLNDPAVRTVALRGLAAYPDANTPQAILKLYPQLAPDERGTAMDTLVSRPAFASALLNAMEKGTVPRADVSLLHARQIQAFNDAVLNEKLLKTWGTIRPASQTRAAQTARLKDLLTPEVLKQADRSHGRQLYTQHCGSCHKLFGTGGDLGPELTGSQRANLDYVLENVLDPSAVVPREYRLTNVTLLDGRLISGIIAQETPQTLTVRTVQESLTIPKGDIEARKETAISLMPEGLFDTLRNEELRDLVAYLASAEQVPLPR